MISTESLQAIRIKLVDDLEGALEDYKSVNRDSAIAMLTRLRKAGRDHLRGLITYEKSSAVYQQVALCLLRELDDEEKECTHAGVSPSALQEHKEEFLKLLPIRDPPTLAEHIWRLLVDIPPYKLDRMLSILDFVEKKASDIDDQNLAAKLAQWAEQTRSNPNLNLQKADSLKPSSKIGVRGYFAGREAELRTFKDVLSNPKSQQRTLFISGGGGVGKTWLIEKMLEEANRHRDILAPDKVVDVFSTDNRHIDGIQQTIRRMLEPLAPGHFADYDKRPTSEQFRLCLSEVCKKQTVVLAFDTFEHAPEVVCDWVLGDDERSLQMPGLICLVGSRKGLPVSGLVRPIELTGFTLDEAIALYRRVTLDATVDEALTQFLEGLVEKTGGHPLMLELVFAWLGGGLWNREALDQLSQSDFERKLMEHVREFGEQDLLYVNDIPIGWPVYQTIVCMAYLNRRFNKTILQRLIGGWFVELRDAQAEDILGSLERYFFVKVRASGEMQLHDRLTDMVMQYLWPHWGGGSKRRPATACGANPGMV